MCEEAETKLCYGDDKMAEVKLVSVLICIAREAQTMRKWKV